VCGICISSTSAVNHPKCLVLSVNCISTLFKRFELNKRQTQTPLPHTVSLSWNKFSTPIVPPEKSQLPSKLRRPPFQRAPFTVLTTIPTLSSSWSKLLRRYMCVPLPTTVIVEPVQGPILPSSSPAFGVVTRAIPCLSALTHRQMLKPR
jgi:hypothetical protein